MRTPESFQSCDYLTTFAARCPQRALPAQVLVGLAVSASRHGQTRERPKVSKVVIALPRSRRVGDNAPYPLHELSFGIGIIRLLGLVQRQKSVGGRVELLVGFAFQTHDQPQQPAVGPDDTPDLTLFKPPGAPARGRLALEQLRLKLR